MRPKAVIGIAKQKHGLTTFFLGNNFFEGILMLAIRHKFGNYNWYYDYIVKAPFIYLVQMSI